MLQATNIPLKIVQSLRVKSKENNGKTKARGVAIASSLVFYLKNVMEKEVFIGLWKNRVKIQEKGREGF